MCYLPLVHHHTDVHCSAGRRGLGLDVHHCSAGGLECSHVLTGLDNCQGLSHSSQAEFHQCCVAKMVLNAGEATDFGMWVVHCHQVGTFFNFFLYL